jgi:hypothetical protein
MILARIEKREASTILIGSRTTERDYRKAQVRRLLNKQ